MRSIVLFLLLILLSNTATLAQQKRQLVWSDEFNYTGAPDSKKWIYEQGFIRNQEKQYYTSSQKNAYVHNGVLEIKAKKENCVNESYKAGTQEWRTKDSIANYTSASINTLGKASWQYGRIEVRAKLSKGLGVWPAIWMMGINRQEVHWPTCGEIDIMEFVGHDSASIFGSIHFATDKNAEKHGSSHSKIEVIKPYNDFHIYAMEWDSSEIRIFFDDKLYHSFRTENADTGKENPFRKPFYLLINLALGGSWGGPIEDSNLPQSYLIDYVRVYQ